MAKVNSVITLQGTYDGITYVKSPTYGDHIRAKRGTRKKAVMNDACKAQSKKIARVNGPAKIIKDAIRPYNKDFYDGKMWSRLVSAVNEHLVEGEPFDFSKLVLFEIHDAYHLQRFFNLRTDTRANVDRSLLNICISYDTLPTFDKPLSLDGYRVGVIGIFPDHTKGAKTAIVYSEIKALEGRVAPLEMEIPVPSEAKTFLICVRVDGCWRGELYNSFGAKGMRILEGGVIGE